MTIEELEKANKKLFEISKLKETLKDLKMRIIYISLSVLLLEAVLPK